MTLTLLFKLLIKEVECLDPNYFDNVQLVYKIYSLSAL